MSMFDVVKQNQEARAFQATPPAPPEGNPEATVYRIGDIVKLKADVGQTHNRFIITTWEDVDDEDNTNAWLLGFDNIGQPIEFMIDLYNGFIEHWTPNNM